MRYLIMPLILISLSGCASIFKSNQHELQLSSNPSGAAVAITDSTGSVVYNGSTPATVNLKTDKAYFSGETYTVRFTSAGQERQVPIATKVRGWYFGNLLLGGLIGMVIVDPLTGAMWKLDRDSVSVDFRSAENTVRVITIDEATDEMRSKMVPIG